MRGRIVVSVQGQDHLHVNVQRHYLVAQQERSQNEIRVASFAKDFEPGRLLFFRPGDGEKWYGSLIDKPMEKWNSTATIMMQVVAESGHPVFWCSSPLSRGVLASK